MSDGNDGGGDGPSLAYFTAVEFYRQEESLRAKLARTEAALRREMRESRTARIELDRLRGVVERLGIQAKPAPDPDDQTGGGT